MNKTETIGSHILIKGRVQGVGFRYFAQHQALLIKLNGWVRNIGNNQVEVLAEGSRDKLKQFIELLKQGPAQARVENCEINWLDAEGTFNGFEIRPSQ